MTEGVSGNLPNPLDEFNKLTRYKKQAASLYLWAKEQRLYRGWLLTSPEKIGVELLTQHDFPKIPGEIEGLLKKSIAGKITDFSRMKVVVHFYHEPKDLEPKYRSIYESNKVLLDRAFRILWVHNKGNDFSSAMLAKIPEELKKYCRFLKMPKNLQLIPINFTVIAPHHDDNTLTYVRLPGHRDIKFGIKIEEVDELAIKFNQLALYCLASLMDDDDDDWGDLIDSATTQCKHWSENEE